MKKFSRLDLLSNAVMDNAGGLIYRLFESDSTRMNIKTSLYDLKRAQVFVGTVNDILEDEIDFVFTLEKMIGLFYEDFLRQIDRGTTLDQLAKWIRSLQDNEQSDISINHYLQEKQELNIDDLKRHFKKKNSRKDEDTFISVKIMKRYVLRGEVLLHDLNELHPDIELDVEEFLSLRFKDIMTQIKNGDYNVLKNIIDLLTF
jgi:DNA mismatch repair ATPase MutS